VIDDKDTHLGTCEGLTAVPRARRRYCESLFGLCGIVATADELTFKSVATWPAIKAKRPAGAMAIWLYTSLSRGDIVEIEHFHYVFLSVG